MALLRPHPSTRRAVVGCLAGVVSVTIVGLGMHLSGWRGTPEARPTMPVVLQPAAVAVEDVVVTTPPVVGEAFAVPASALEDATAGTGDVTPTSTTEASPATSPVSTPHAPSTSPVSAPTTASPSTTTAPSTTIAPSTTVAPSTNTSTSTVVSPLTDTVGALTTGLGNILTATTDTLTSTLGALLGH